MNYFVMNTANYVDKTDEYILFFQIMHNTLELHGKESGQIWHRKGSGKHGYILLISNKK